MNTLVDFSLLYCGKNTATPKETKTQKLNGQTHRQTYTETERQRQIHREIGRKKVSQIEQEKERD